MQNPIMTQPAWLARLPVSRTVRRRWNVRHDDARIVPFRTIHKRMNKGSERR